MHTGFTVVDAPALQYTYILSMLLFLTMIVFRMLFIVGQ